MRKIAIIAMFAIVAAMVPMTTAGSQPAGQGTLDGVGTLMIINARVGAAVTLVLEIEDGEFQGIALTNPDQEEFQIPRGTHQFRVCATAPALVADLSCTGSAPLGTVGSFQIQSNDILNFLITASPPALPTGVYVEENDTEETETDEARLTVFNASGVAISLCVGDSHEIAAPGGAPSRTIAEFNSQDGETRELKIYIPGSNPQDCALAPTSSRDLGFPSGSNTVINFPAFAEAPFAGSTLGYQIFPGFEPPHTDQLVDAFCAVVLEAANITAWLQDLFAEVEVGNEDTYPSPEKVEKVITRVAELLEKGDETAPNDIRDAWLTATAAFVETGRLAAVDYDLEALPQDDLRDLVLRIDTPAEDDHEVVAATDALAAWVPANCFGDGAAAIEAEPSFTG